MFGRASRSERPGGHIAESPSSCFATPPLRSGPARRLAARRVTASRRRGFLAFVLLLRGPVALRGMVGQASHLAEQLRGLHKVASQTEALASKTTTSQ